ncbi:Aste57867_24082 [Aphanomyces stellatus]|uniref:Aste57867_24082 protein n=1 Tax=Aphanomyces stellatus TaxID=120398 RepID=A0A485LPQ3_9STRA|nr:hypothetical protein As57867_024009 [Aphanomyces stellatus]VFU00724.1 Aste57867_24082 [Aphanomyces stellatus]
MRVLEVLVVHPWQVYVCGVVGHWVMFWSDMYTTISERLQVVFEDHGIAGGNITRQFLETTLSNFVERLAPRANLPSDSPDSTHHSVLHSWGGRLFMLPKEFEFPSVDPASTWKLWWLGNDRKSQPPYRFISPLDLSSNKQRKILSSWKFMLGRFERVCLDAGLHMPQHPTEEDIARLYVPVALYIRDICSAAPRKRTCLPSQLRLVSLVRRVRNATSM